MLLFEKSLIGAYCNRLYDLGEKHGPFLCYGRIRANSAGKDGNITKLKVGPPNRQIDLTLNSSFL